MPKLADHITVQPRFARSANVERDADRPEPLDGYVVTNRALDVVEGVMAAGVSGAGGAWSVTGPYGSGKSSLALLLDASLGPRSAVRDRAWRLLDEASPRVSEMVKLVHQRHRTEESGFHRAVVTANREPLTLTVLRALHTAVIRSYGRIPRANRFKAAAALRGAIEDAAAGNPRRAEPSPPAMVEIAVCLARTAPLLLVIDEFGKNLEAVQDGGDTDPYLLQQLAEAGQGLGQPIFLVTLQHLSFEDYLGQAAVPQRKEWAKVQGRFEDVAYVESSHQTRALIGSVFQVNDDHLGARIRSWAEPLAKRLRAVGFTDLGDSQHVASCYPLHPVVAMVLPELCSRYGQNERTLFSFLASSEPSSASSFLAKTDFSMRGQLPCHGVEAAYDYFVDSGALGASSAIRSGRWTEIATRLRDVHGLSKPQIRLAKAVALLNLVSTTGAMRASSRLLELIDSSFSDTIQVLENLGIVTYRNFSDEYRIWQGTDVDLQQLLDTAHQQVARQSLLEVLIATPQPSPVVAARHSAQHEVLRVFSRRFVAGAEQIEPLPATSEFDGEVLLVVGSAERVPKLAGSPDQVSMAKPVVAAVPGDLTELDRAARERSALAQVLSDPSVQSDWVARRELGERMAAARVAFDDAISKTFSAEGCEWFLLNGDRETRLRGGRGSAALSDAADHVYSSSPIVRNEMLNRVQLTTQGSKARRILLEAMIEHGNTAELGLKGYGPEMAMYRAILASTGLHGFDSRNETMVFRSPADTTFQPAWRVIQDEFKRATARRVRLSQVYAALQLPPIGMKVGVIPVVLTAALLAYGEEVAIYEHGTFKPILTPDVSERMVRNPGHFEIKHFANTTGARREVVEAMAKRLALRPAFRKHRVANVLSVVGHMVGRVRRLNTYSRQTSNLGDQARGVRNTLASAVEPDELLFRELPAVLGLAPVTVEATTYMDSTRYADLTGAALDELTECYSELLNNLLRSMLEISEESNRTAIRGRAVALPLDALDATIRPFILALANDSITRDADWMNAVGTVVAGKAPSEWTDSDLSQFRRELHEQLSTFRRLVALYAMNRPNGDAAANTLRIMITGSDGHEDVRLVSVDQSQRQNVVSLLDGVLGELADVLGSRQDAHHALLALLGERMIETRDRSRDVIHGAESYSGAENV